MKTFKSAGLAAILVWLPALAFAQLPGEPKAPPAYDPTGDARYRFQLGAPDERVREAQRVLQEKGYYHGPLDGLMTPEMRRALWSFQKSEGFRLSGRLDAPTMAALGLAPKDAPSNLGSQPSASPRSSDVEKGASPPLNNSQAP